MKIKKLFSLALGGVLLLVSLTGCGSTASTSSSTAPSSSATASSASPSGVTKIVCSTAGQPKPFSYVDENGNPVGYDIELVEAVFKLLPQYQLVIQVDNDPLGDVDSGRSQLSANNWGYKDERAQKYIYSDATFQNNYVIAVAENNNTITKFDDLQGKTCESGTGSNYSIAMTNYNNSLSSGAKPIQIQYTDSDLLVQLQNIESGKTDFQLIDQQMFNQYVKQYGLKLKGVALSSDDLKKVGTPYSYVIFEKNDQGRALQQAFNEALKTVLTNGTGDEISQKYFNSDFAPQPGIKAPSEAS